MAAAGSSGKSLPIEARARSGPAGLFLLPLGAGRYDLRIRAAGHARRLLPDQRAPDPGLRIDLEAGYTISGRVKGCVNGVRVEAHPLADPEHRPVVSTEPDLKGSFLLQGLGLGSYRVQAVEPSGESAQQHSVLVGTRDIELQLLPRRSLSGLVLDGRDAGVVAGALVTLGGSGLWPPRSTLSDAHGRYRFADLRSGWYSLRAVKEPMLASGFIEGVRVPPGVRDVDQPLVVDRHHGLEILVLRARGDEPVPHASLTLAPTLPSVLAIRGSTDCRGRVRLGPLPRGPYMLHLRAPGVASLVAEPIELKGVDEHGKAGGLLRLRVPAAASLAGRVVDQLGRPLTHAQCFVEAEGGAAAHLARPGDASVRSRVRGWLGVGRGRETTSTGRSDGSGHFGIDSLPPGNLGLLCQHHEHLPARKGPWHLAPGERRRALRIELPACASIEGLVVDTEGDPVALATIRFCTRSATISDAHGRFLLRAAPGEGVLAVDAAGHAPLRQLLRVEAGQPPTSVLLTLEQGLRPLRGHVLGPDGADVAGARVILRGAQGLSQESRSQPSGDFLIPDPPPTPWTLEVLARGAARWQGAIAQDGRPVEVELQAGGTLRLEVLEAGTYEPLPRARVELSGPGRMHWTGRLGNGFLAVDHLPAGSYQVHVKAPGHLARQRSQVLVEDRLDPAPVRFLLPLAGSLAGTVSDTDGRPMRGAQISAEPLGDAAGPQGMLKVRSDPHGRFRLSPLPDGTVRIRAQAAGHQEESRMERVVAGESYEGLELRLMPLP